MVYRSHEVLIASDSLYVLEPEGYHFRSVIPNHWLIQSFCLDFVIFPLFWIVSVYVVFSLCVCMSHLEVTTLNGLVSCES